MDPRERADALLSRARKRSGRVVTPDNMVSPMDAANTQQIPSSVVAGIDRETDDSTTVLPSSVIEEQDPLAENNPTRPLRTGATDAEEDEELDGLIPTSKPATPGQSSLARRLEGL